MSATVVGAGSDSVPPQAMRSRQLDDEAAALASDILPIFTSTCSIESIWSAERIAFTAERRSIIFGQKLFFDELLSFASVDTSLYPPRSSDQLLKLLTAIFAASTLDYLKQLSLVYYLLLDLDTYIRRNGDGQDTSSSASTAERFADTYVVLPQFTDAMQGYWLLDNDQYEQAIPLLSVADFVPKIVRTLFLASSTHPTRSDVARAKLLLRFLRTSKQLTSSPPGSEPFLQEVEMQIQALCFVVGPSRAFAEIRSLTGTIQNDEHQRVSVRARLILKVLEHCFAPPRSAAIQNLLACSLDPEEEVTLESFVLSPPAAMTAAWSYVAADVLIIRYISQGRYMDAVGLDRRLGPDVSLGHSTAKDAQQRSKMMEQRRRMIAGAREILPEVQKELLRIEESAEISGGLDAEQKVHRSDASLNAANGESASSDVAADRSQLALTPLSASPATRRSNTHTPSTQAAILSAVVRASASPSVPLTPTKTARLGGSGSAAASPSSTPRRTTSTPQQPTAMMGFLARNALSGKRSTADSDPPKAVGEDDVMEDALEEIDGSAVLVSAPVDSVESLSGAIASPSKPIQAASPWRNQPSLTSSSPFSGQPKLTRPAIANGAPDSMASASRSPYQSSPRTFQPANNSPFAASGSVRSSPSLSMSGRAKLPGALGLISQHGKKSRLRRDEPSFDMDDSDMDDTERRTEDEAADEAYGDDTFIQSGRAKTVSKGAGGDVSIGRLVPGRRGWKESQDDAEGNERFEEPLASPEPPTKRRTRKAAAIGAGVTPSKSKMTRSRTGVNLNEDASTQPKLSKSRSEVSLASKRTTRSSSAANRKPLTLSNLEQHSRQDGAADMDAAPIARRTRAATAELESINGSQVAGGADGGASTIYTISELGDAADDHDVGRISKSPVKRGSRRTAITALKGGVRRSNRLSSVEPEGGLEMSQVASPARRRGGVAATTRKTLTSSSSTRSSSKMPGTLE